MTTAAKLANKRVLVTGAGTGIGQAIAREFARQGAAVVFHCSHSETAARADCAGIVAQGGKATVVHADFRELDAPRLLAEQSLEFLGGLDVLINNAGITLNRRFEKVTPEQFDTLYNVNVRGPFFLTQHLIPALEKSRGVILNLSSIHAQQGAPGHSVYAGTKGAIISSARELAIELAPRGIRVNCIAPGAVTVDSHRDVMGTDPDAIGKGIPCGFAGAPEDVAKLAAFLASDDARYILGQTIVIDGGTTSWIAINEGFRNFSDAPFGRGYVPGV